MSNVKLGVNIDHVATIRQARGTRYPEPVQAALLAETAGADSITMHLREDRRHIIDRDMFAVKEVLSVPLNMEMAVTEEMLKIAEKVQPAYCCLVPEKREELTTEGGLDVIAQSGKIAEAVARLTAADILVSLFIDPDLDQIEMAHRLKAPVIEIHTGAYAEAQTADLQQAAIDKITLAAQKAYRDGLVVNAGHGLHYQNTRAIAAISEMHELNIGHSIIARAVMTGLPEAVEKMKAIIQFA